MTPIPLNHGQKRAQQMQVRLERLRKEQTSSRDAQIRGTSGATSARDFLTKSLGKANEPKRGSSVARLNTPYSPTGLGPLPKLPPKLGR